MILAANLHYYYYNSYYYYVPAKIKHEEEFTTILEPKNHPSLLLLVSLSRSPLSLMLTTSSTSSLSAHFGFKAFIPRVVLLQLL